MRDSLRVGLAGRLGFLVILCGGILLGVLVFALFVRNSRPRWKGLSERERLDAARVWATVNPPVLRGRVAPARGRECVEVGASGDIDCSKVVSLCQSSSGVASSSGEGEIAIWLHVFEARWHAEANRYVSGRSVLGRPRLLYYVFAFGREKNEISCDVVSVDPCNGELYMSCLVRGDVSQDYRSEIPWGEELFRVPWYQEQ